MPNEGPPAGASSASGPSERTGPSLHEQAKALGDPTRFAIFDYLRMAGRPVGVGELTAHLGVTHNAVRRHLYQLRDADLIIEETRQQGRPGRPSLRYRLTPGAIERWETAGPYQELSLMLLELLDPNRTPRDVGRATGIRLAGELKAVGSDPVEMLEGVTRRLGFEPRRIEAVCGTETSTELVLDRCPFAAGARLAPTVVCELHRGIAEGVCQVSGSPVQVRDLIVGIPQQGGCRLTLDTAGPANPQPNQDEKGCQRD